MRIRWSVRRTLIGVALIAVGLALWRWSDPAVRYRATGDSTAFYEVLKNQIKNGDSVEQVQWRLGQAHLITDPNHLAGSRNYTRRTPGENPQGVEDRDVFFSYRAGGWNITLQARDGRLVNFDPSSYPLKLGDVLGR